MAIDFSPLDAKEISFLDFSTPLTVDELRQATNESIDTMLEIIRATDDAGIVFVPYDPDADDPYAVEGEKNIGWTLGHLVVHVTSSSEEWATYSSILARGIPYPAEPRLRYETDWKSITTQAQAIQRLEESRRMRLAYLESWPDEPNLELLRELSPRFEEHFGRFNAPACFVFGLQHERGHHAQFREVLRQAQEAANA